MSSESYQLRPGGEARALDFGAVLRAVLPPFAAWAAAALFVTFAARQPGVICVTPVAWLMACWVGVSCVARSRSLRKGALLTEAALAGALSGLLQGLLFAALAPFMGDVRPDEQQKAVFMSVAVIAIGTVVSALLSVAVGAAQANRRAAK